MSDDASKKTGLRVGDFNVRPTGHVRTSVDLDTEADRERARRAEEDRQAAQHSAGDGEADEAKEAALYAVNDAIEQGRDRAAGADGAVPILLRDPVTGREIKLP